MPKRTMTDQKPTESEDNSDVVTMAPDDELATVKAILVSVLKLMGGKVTVPLIYLDQFPYNGSLRTNVTDNGMVVEYTEPEGGD